MRVRSVSGAESGPQRALRAPPPLLVPVTTTVTMSSEAKTQQPSAAPAAALSTSNTKPVSTGSERRGEWWPGWPHISSTRRLGQEGHRNEGFGNSEMVQCKERIRFRQQE
ncbi:hypothetical protein STEG23_022346 [Scotinomys teguina]